MERTIARYLPYANAYGWDARARTNPKQVQSFNKIM